MMSERIESALKTGRLGSADQTIVEARGRQEFDTRMPPRMRLRTGAIVARASSSRSSKRSGLMRLGESQGARSGALMICRAIPTISMAINISTVTGCPTRHGADTQPPG